MRPLASIRYGKEMSRGFTVAIRCNTYRMRRTSAGRQSLMFAISELGGGGGGVRMQRIAT